MISDSKAGVVELAGANFVGIHQLRSLREWGGQIYKDAYAQRRVSQKDIPTGIEGQYRTDGQSNIEQTYRTTDNIRVVKRRKGRGKRNENRWRRKTENKLNVAKESCVSCRCDGLGGKNQT